MPPPSTQDEFFDEPRAVSLHKLNLYGDYLTPWTYKLASGFRNLHVVDGFAGAGMYRRAQDGKVQDGSPRVAAVWAAEQERVRGYPVLQCINVEADAGRYAELQRNLAPWPGLVTNLPGTFAANLDAILERVQRNPVFFFLDPFGVAGIEMALIEQILKRGGRHNELLIHFSDRAFKRMAGHVVNRDRLPVGRKVAESKLARLDAVLGSPMWRRWWQDGADTDAAFDKIVDLYLAQLRERGFAYAAPIAMRDNYGERPRYRLIFATRSAHGIALMSDIACRYERRLYDEHLAGQLDLLASSDEKVRARELRDRVHQTGLALAAEATLEQIIHHLAPRLFGKHTRPEYAQAIRDLVREGLIDRDSPKGVGDREPLRFIVPAQGSLLAG